MLVFFLSPLLVAIAFASVALSCCAWRSIALVIIPTFQSLMLMYVIPPFALMQKVEPKNGGKPEPLRASCRPRTTTVITAFTFNLFRSKKLVSLLHATFLKPHFFITLSATFLH
jgi:hypothetical protein